MDVDAKLVHVLQPAGHVDELARALREHRSCVASASWRPGLAVDNPVVMRLALRACTGDCYWRILQVLVGDEFPGDVGLDDVSVGVDDHLVSSGTAA